MNGKRRAMEWVVVDVLEEVVGSGNGSSCPKLNPSRGGCKMGVHHSERSGDLAVFRSGLSWMARKVPVRDRFVWCVRRMASVGLELESTLTSCFITCVGTGAPGI